MNLEKTNDKMTLQEHLDEIMDNFDFEAVRRYMESVGWKWYDTEEGVPSVAELRRKVRAMIKDLWSRYESLTDCGQFFCDCGGFLVTIDKHKDGKGESVNLRFVIEDYCSDPDGSAIITLSDS